MPARTARTRTLSAGRLRVSWTDADERRHAIDVQLDAAWLSAPRERTLDPETAGVGEAACREVRAWGSARGLTVDAEPQGLGLSVRIQGPAELVERHGPGLDDAIRVAQDRATTAAGYRRVATGALVVDLPRMAVRYAPRLVPLAQGLLATVPARDYAGFADRALAFVQSIPYVAEMRRFTLPAGVLAEDHGDCDEKSLVFLALLKAAFPKAPAVVVQPPGHALVGLPLPAGPHRLPVHGRSWALCEPAGPGLFPVGMAGDDTVADLRSSAADVLLVR